MAPIKLGNISVEIAVKTIDGFIHELIEVPVKSGFWISFTVTNEHGKSETFPLVDKHHKLKVYDTYAEALHDAAQKLMKKNGVAHYSPTGPLKQLLHVTPIVSSWPDSSMQRATTDSLW